MTNAQLGVIWYAYILAIILILQKLTWNITRIIMAELIQQQ